MSLSRLLNETGTYPRASMSATGWRGLSSRPVDGTYMPHSGVLSKEEGR